MKLLFTYAVTADTRTMQDVDDLALAYAAALTLRFKPEATKADLDALPSVTDVKLVSVTRPLIPR